MDVALLSVAQDPDEAPFFDTLIPPRLRPHGSGPQWAARCWRGSAGRQLENEDSDGGNR